MGKAEGRERFKMLVGAGTDPPGLHPPVYAGRNGENGTQVVTRVGRSSLTREGGKLPKTGEGTYLLRGETYSREEKASDMDWLRKRSGRGKGTKKGGPIHKGSQVCLYRGRSRKAFRR